MERIITPQLDAAELGSALTEGRFELHYQPQFTTRQHSLSGVEGLVRLRRLDGRLVPPGQFVPGLEATGFIHEVGAELFRQGCADAAGWPSLIVAINVSPIQFQDADFPTRLVNIAKRQGVDCRQIEIEITESVFFDEPEQALRALTFLSNAGFSLAIDDFGTGYSSLSSLLNFPINKIKIDRSFVSGAVSNSRATAIIHAIVALARALGLKVVAEGVETVEQRTFLRTVGCHFLQGFLFSGALERKAISALVLENMSAIKRA